MARPNFSVDELWDMLVSVQGKIAAFNTRNFTLEDLTYLCADMANGKAIVDMLHEQVAVIGGGVACPGLGSNES